MIDESNEDGIAVYINFPFCKKPCSYCHYMPNIKFGYEEIPNEYFKQVCTQLEDTCKRLKKAKIDSIYFGGGTPSLLDDSQIEKLKRIFDDNEIVSEEISIEVHPGMCKFDYKNNNWFTRYSVGIQSVSDDEIRKYNRANYTFSSLEKFLDNIDKGNKNRKINFDFIFSEKIPKGTCNFINKMKPYSVVLYPNTKGRGYNRLNSVLTTLNEISDSLSGYIAVGKSKFIFTRDGGPQSEYAHIENETLGTIYGVGDNSVSYMGKKSYLCKYDEHGYYIKERERGDRIILAIVSGISTGIRAKMVQEYFSGLISSGTMKKIKNDKIIGGKHYKLSDSELIYLPSYEYKFFYEYLMQEKGKLYADAFLRSVEFGDCDVELLNRIDRDGFIYTKEIIHKKKSLPDVKILIEGIDGSGKDTFAFFLIEELKKRFYFESGKSVSIMGQPMSNLKFGKQAKKFVEELAYDDFQHIEKILTVNRLESEKIISQKKGVVVLIRGYLTDKFTYEKVKGNTAPCLGMGKIIGKWDKLIIVDCNPVIADSRIEKRGIPRTWRESLDNLKYFRKKYLEYDNDNLFKEKIVIKNIDIDSLQETASKIAGELYERQ